MLDNDEHDDEPSVSECPISQDLMLRMTHTYVGTYQHDDDWETIGRLKEIGSQLIPRSEADEEDPCDPINRELFVIVTPDPDSNPGDAAIKRALSDTYTQWGCHHEHDCCGCRSFSASGIERVTGDVWKVRIHSSRNF